MFTKTKTVAGALTEDFNALTAFNNFATKVIVGTGGIIHILYADGTTDTLAKTYDGQEIPGLIWKILVDTTARDITLVCEQ